MEGEGDERGRGEEWGGGDERGGGDKRGVEGEGQGRGGVEER